MAKMRPKCGLTLTDSPFLTLVPASLAGAAYFFAALAVTFLVVDIGNVGWF